MAEARWRLPPSVLEHPVEREVPERVGRHVARDLVHRVARRDELAPRRRVDAVVAGPLGGRARDAKVHLARAGVAHHLDDLARRRPADDRVVDDHDALAAQHRLDGAQLQAHAEVTDALLRLDERAAHVVRPDEAHLERDAPRRRVADGGRDARVGHRDDDVGLDGVLARQGAAERLARRRRRSGRRAASRDARSRRTRRRTSAAAPAAAAGASACPCCR